jgi:hypothetical protein
MLSLRADRLFEKFRIGRGKGRSGIDLPLAIPDGVSAGAGAG